MADGRRSLKRGKQNIFFDKFNSLNKLQPKPYIYILVFLKRNNACLLPFLIDIISFLITQFNLYENSKS